MSERLTRTSVTVLVPDGRQCCDSAAMRHHVMQMNAVVATLETQSAHAIH